MTINRTNLSLGTTATELTVGWENNIVNAINDIKASGQDEQDVFRASGFGYNGFLPRYVDANNISVSRGATWTTSGNVLIYTTSSTNISTATLGLGGFLQTANLAGTASCSGVTVTGSGTSFSTDFQIGDVIWFTGGATRRITAIGSNTSMTVESSLTQSSTNYRRGGCARNTFYYLYAIRHNTTATTSSLVMTARNIAGGDTIPTNMFPANYGNHVRQLPFAIKTYATSETFHAFSMLGWGSTTPLFHYDTRMTEYDAPTGVPTQVLANASGTGYQTVDVSSFIPTGISKVGFFNATSSTTSNFYRFRTNATLNNVHSCTTDYNGMIFFMPLNGTTIEFNRNSGTTYLDVKGYYITEVF